MFVLSLGLEKAAGPEKRAGTGRFFSLPLVMPDEYRKMRVGMSENSGTDVGIRLHRADIKRLLLFARPCQPSFCSST
jgi:hypothetical protein